MAGSHIKFEATGLKPLHERVKVLASADTSSLMPRIGEYLQRSTQARFKAQEAPDGSAWEALKPRTVKRKKYNAKKVLTELGYLRKNIFYQVLGPSRVEVYSNAIYGATHQFGREEAKIPARPFLGISSEDGQELQAIIKDWAAEFGYS